MIKVLSVNLIMITNFLIIFNYNKVMAVTKSVTNTTSPNASYLLSNGTDSTKTSDMITIRLIEAINSFGFDLFRKLHAQRKVSENVIISPLTIYSLCAILLAGSKSGTARELREALRLDTYQLSEQQTNEGLNAILSQFRDPTRNPDYQFVNANYYVIEKESLIASEYIEFVKKYYDETIFIEKFVGNNESASFVINNWIRVRTRGKLNKVVADNLINNDTKMVFANGVYFKGVWFYKFQSRRSNATLFRNDLPVNGTSTPANQSSAANDSSVEVKMLSQTGVKLNYSDSYVRNAKYVELPYRKHISLLLLLPNSNNHSADSLSLSRVVSAINLAAFEGLSKNSTPTPIDIQLPPFRIENTHNLKESLPLISVRQVFTPKADLSGIGGQKNLRLSVAMHKTVVEVSGEGADTPLPPSMVNTTIAAREIAVNHPFMFAIRDNRSGLYLMIGAVHCLPDQSESDL